MLQCKASQPWHVYTSVQLPWGQSGGGKNTALQPFFLLHSPVSVNLALVMKCEAFLKNYSVAIYCDVSN